jgi:hypothetical protein
MTMSNNDKIEQLWQIAYNAIEKRPAETIRTTLGMKQASNDLQFRMAKSIAVLKDKGISQPILDAIKGDVLGCETYSILTHETADKMLLIIDDLERTL